MTEITREELCKLYNEKKVDEVLKILGLHSHCALYGLLKRAKIPLKKGPITRKSPYIKVI